jgi:quinohemoprotein ethanol dehydrogenase
MPLWKLMVLLAPAGLLAQQAQRVDDTALRNAGKSGGEWLTYGLNQAETRFSPLSQLNTSNVRGLRLAWSYDLGPGGGWQEATPLIWNGTLYGITNWSVVFAVDARTGKERWRWDPEVNQDKLRPKICCGVVNRGVALFEGLIIAPVIDGRLNALDAQTGKPVWEARVEYAQHDYTITMAPRIAKGKVIIGVSGSELPVRGFFDAFDAATGRHAWRFYTVPGDPAKGFENQAMRKAAATWSGEWWKLAGGGAVWDGIAYDPEADLIYVGTGNGGPWPEELRHSKGKDNLYLCSILAVKADTGELKWHFQAVPGDDWDYDSVQQLTLADLNIRGQTRKVIMQANKNGFYYVLDRLTGAFISGQPFGKVTWAKGLDEATGRPIVNPEAHYGTEAVNVSPGPSGAHNWAPMSFSPLTGLVYIPTTTNSTFSYATDPNFTYEPGRSNTGLVRRTGEAPVERYIEAQPPRVANAPEPPAIGPEPVEGQPGALVAWDPVAQKERWRGPVGGSMGGGTVATAGNLVLQVLSTGRLLAYSADKGEKLLDIPTGLTGGMAPPVTYEVGGKQYVSLMGGMGRVVPRYGPAPAINPSAPAPPSPKLLTYGLVVE